MSRAFSYRFDPEVGPSLPASRQRFFSRYFQDFSVTLEEKEQTQIEINTPGSFDFYIDPVLQDNLDKVLGLTRVQDIPFYHIGKRNGIFALQDSWSLYGWSTRLEQMLDQPQITLVHLDYHDDFMKAFVYKKNNKFIDRFTHQLFDIFVPETVRQAVRSGAVDIGSILTPLVHFPLNVRILHLCPGNLNTVGHYAVKPCLEFDDLLFNGQFPRLSVQFSRRDNIPLQSSYSVFHSVYELVKYLPSDRELFLHIDMDYFNCRFMGSPHWKSIQGGYNPDIDVVLAEINSLSEVFKPFACQTSHVSVCLSPGFFPSDLWIPALSTIVNSFSASGFEWFEELKELLRL